MLNLSHWPGLQIYPTATSTVIAGWHRHITVILLILKTCIKQNVHIYSKISHGSIYIIIQIHI